MKVWSIAFTQRGLGLAAHLVAGLAEQGDEAELFCGARLAQTSHGTKGLRHVEHVDEWAREAFGAADALVFVGACGIATRAIAPYVRDKLCDPAVVCVDEAGRFAIPLLSGHVGGANELARRVSALCAAQPVITTATDVRGVFAVDEWARQKELAILDRDEAKRVSAALLAGEPVGFVVDEGSMGLPKGVFGGRLPKGLVVGEEATTCRVGIVVTLDSTRKPFAHTLRLVPRTVVVGVGCKRGTASQSIRDFVDDCLARAKVAPEAVCALATISIKADEPGVVDLANERGWELRLYDAAELAAVPGEFSSSEFVRRTVGVDNVCERAACAGGATLLLGKQSASGATVAIAASPVPYKPSVRPPAKLACVGIGPGGADDLTLRAHKALLSAEVIVGYTTYVDLVRSSYPHAEFVTTGMRAEVRRCRLALERAEAGERVAMVCSGDPGVYGMAGLLLELAPEYPGVEVEVIPGVTAANGGAAVLGAPLMHDWCCISLSDLLTPWGVIEKRLRAAAQADLCIVLYNPASRGRADHLRRACDVLLEHASAKTVCGLVRNIGREGQASVTTTLGELASARADMLTCVFVGNSHTRLVCGRMVTPRGYNT